MQSEGVGDAESRCIVVWLGDDTPLLRLAWQHADVHHVVTARTALQALESGLVTCLVVDVTLPELDTEALLKIVRHQWPHVGLLVLGPEEAGSDPAATSYADVDRYVPRDVAPDDLLAILKYLSQRAQRHHSGGDYRTLQRRTRQLEGLLQASFTFSSTLNASNIVGDLREIGRIAVDADDVAVLIATEDYSDLFDGLDLGVAPEYLEVCRTHLQSLPPDERVIYLSSEVLLRERLPDMLPTAIRVREATAAGAWSYMRVPMTVEDRLIGFVALFSERPNCFNGAHLQLGRLFASQVTTAVRNMDLFWRLNHAEHRQRAVSRVARLIADDLDLDTLLSRIVEEAVLLIEGLAGLVQLVEGDRSLRVAAVHNLPDALVGHSGLGGEHSGAIATTGRPLVLTGPRDWDGLGTALGEVVPPDAVWVGVPLTHHGLVTGVLQVIRKRRDLDDIRDVEDVLMMLAPQAATAIAKAQLYEIVRQEQRHLQAVLANSPALIVVFDAEGRADLANHEAEQVFKRLGMSFEQLKGQNIFDLAKNVLPEDMLPPESLIDAPDKAIEITLGGAGEFLLRAASITAPDGAIDGYVAIAQDVTELRRVDRLKANLMRVLTHDLGNLLMLAHSPIQLLDAPETTPEEREMLKKMLHSSLNRMENLVRDVTDLEMSSSLGHETMAPVRLNSLVERTVEQYRSEAEARAIELTYAVETAPPHSLHGHAVLIAQAVSNLVSNAIKYTPDGGRVDVVLGVSGEYATVCVQDTGYGIPKDQLDVIFEPFVRIKNPRTAQERGTGLGLTLVKSFAETHGGHVTVTSTLDEGSTFTLYLPLKPREVQPTKPKQVIRLDLSSYLSNRSPHAGSDA